MEPCGTLTGIGELRNETAKAKYAVVKRQKGPNKAQEQQFGNFYTNSEP